MGRTHTKGDFKELYDHIISDPDYSASIQHRISFMLQFESDLAADNVSQALENLRQYLNVLYAEHKQFRQPKQAVLQAQIRDMEILSTTMHRHLTFPDSRLYIAYDTSCRERIMDATTVQEVDDAMIELIRDSFHLFPRVKEFSTDLERSVCTYINQHISESITTKDIAGHLNISKNTLSRQFKEITGVTVSERIASTKAHYACYYLKSSSMSISQISTLLGYCDSSYFCKVFSQAMDMAPNEYRRKSRQPH
jgi:YesN/AraC family two-component response regulator